MARSRRPDFGDGSFSNISQEVPWTTIARLAPVGFLVLFGLYVAWSSAYTVETNEAAVLFRFGKPIATVDPGLHFKIPFVDEAVPVDMQDRRMRLPFGSGDGERATLYDETPGLMLTGELNAAVVEWDIQYRVEDPQDFLVQIHDEDVEPIISAAATSVMHRLVGDYSIDEILTTEREAVANNARENLQKLLDNYQAGIRVANLNVQRVTPPSQVKDAYDDVNSAVQRRSELINQAQKEKNKILPQAEAESEQARLQAQGEFSRKQQEIDGRIAALKQQYEAYKAAPDVTRRRMYLEALEEVLSGSGEKIIVDEELRGLLPLLNLDGGRK